MMKQQVEKIKDGEKKADGIIKDAETNSSRILSVFDGKIEEFRQEKEKSLNGKLNEFSVKLEEDKKKEIEKIKEKKTNINSELKQTASKNLEKVVESVWGKISKKIF